jgi:hypothetical protein
VAVNPAGGPLRVGAVADLEHVVAVGFGVVGVEGARGRGVGWDAG